MTQTPFKTPEFKVGIEIVSAGCWNHGLEGRTSFNLVNEEGREAFLAHFLRLDEHLKCMQGKTRPRYQNFDRYAVMQLHEPAELVRRCRYPQPRSVQELLQQGRLVELAARKLKPCLGVYESQRTCFTVSLPGPDLPKRLMELCEELLQFVGYRFSRTYRPETCPIEGDPAGNPASWLEEWWDKHYFGHYPSEKEAWQALYRGETFKLAGSFSEAFNASNFWNTIAGSQRDGRVYSPSKEHSDLHSTLAFFTFAEQVVVFRKQGDPSYSTDGRKRS